MLIRGQFETLSEIQITFVHAFSLHARNRGHSIRVCVVRCPQREHLAGMWAPGSAAPESLPGVLCFSAMVVVVLLLLLLLLPLPWEALPGVDGPGVAGPLSRIWACFEWVVSPEGVPWTRLAMQGVGSGSA